MHTILHIGLFLCLSTLNGLIHAQPFLSIENDHRYVRYKAYVGDEIKYKSRMDARARVGIIDSLSTDGYIRINRFPMHTDSIVRVYRKYVFQKSRPLRTLLGGGLVAGSALYMAGNVVNGWITGNETLNAPMTTPVIVMGSGILLLRDWRRSYRMGGRWHARVLEF
jgi:hypothetical protein